MRFGRIFFLIVLSVCIFEAARLWSLVPDPMASHFNFQGNPDNFVPKAQFFAIQAQTALVVIGLSLLMQVLILILPAQLINIPNREYWLGPEQRDETIDRFGSFAAALFGAVLLVVQVGFELAVYANLRKPIFFAAQIMIPAIAGFIIFSFLMLFQLVRSFRPPPSG